MYKYLWGIFEKTTFSVTNEINWITAEINYSLLNYVTAFLVDQLYMQLGKNQQIYMQLAEESTSRLIWQAVADLLLFPCVCSGFSLEDSNGFEGENSSWFLKKANCYNLIWTPISICTLKWFYANYWLQFIGAAQFEIMELGL